MNIEHNQDVEKDAEGQSRLTDVLCVSLLRESVTVDGRSATKEDLQRGAAVYLSLKGIKSIAASADIPGYDYCVIFE